MPQRVRDVGKERPLGADAFCGFNRFFDRKVGHMSLPLTRIEHQYIQISQKIKRRFRNRADVSAVSEITNAKAQYRHLAVQQRDWNPFLATDLKWAVDFLMAQMRAEDLHFRRRFL